MIYPGYLVKVLRKCRDLENYIPKLMYKDDDLKIYHKYISLIDRCCNEPFKIESIFFEEGTRYCTVRYLISSKFAVLPDPVDNIDYEFIKDRHNIKDVNIINNESYYYGSEIKYWFYIHNIDLDSPKYRAFRQYIEMYRTNTISDNTLYQVTGRLVDDNYVHAAFIKIQQKGR